MERTETVGVHLNLNTVGLKFTVQPAAISNSFFYSHFIDTRFNVGAGQVGILMQGDGTIKGSMRTVKNSVDVSRIALLVGGGGHKKAAGFKINGKLVTDGQNWTIV